MTLNLRGGQNYKLVQKGNGKFMNNSCMNYNGPEVTSGLSSL